MNNIASHRYLTMDVFSERVLEGNALAVFPDASGISDITMQQIAAELNLAETVFVGPATRTDCVISLRIFTPKRELNFAGHPTIGTSFVVLKEKSVPEGTLEFALEEKIGPVLRGWAGILEVSVIAADPFRLKLRDIGPEGRRYKKHFLDLNGLGVRDLCVDGEDVLILTGPTMNLDGPVAVFRWRDALESSEEQLIFSDELERLFAVPNGTGFDHAEGMTLVTDPKRLLVV